MKPEVGIKFNCRWLEEKPLDYKYLKELNQWRNRLFKAGLIGVYPDGIGYGNMSIRFQRDKFIITGTATGHLQRLNARHYTQVTAFNLDKNRVTTVGPIKASSESLTHAMLYECNKEINAVFHVHHKGLWKKLMRVVPTTKASIEYGTTAMANEMLRLFKETDLATQKIFVMAGHEDGIVTFGKTMDEAGEKILSELEHFNSN
ncbi:MAG: class II aldolase/adducin family protein [Bacteroidota bacterium]